MRPICSSNSISIPEFVDLPILKRSSSKCFNISKASIPKIAAVIKRFIVLNGSIGDIKPKNSSKLYLLNFYKN